MSIQTQLTDSVERPEDRTLFYIPDVNLSKFEESCAKLSRKSVKLGFSEIKPYVFGYQTKELSDGREHRVYEVLFVADAPKVAGWTFVATLDHTPETGNLIRMVPNTVDAIPETYRNCGPKCEHCNINRFRKTTYVLRSDDGAFKSVGGTCLQDFFGHDPLKIAKMAELLSYAMESARANEEYDLVGGGMPTHWVNVMEYCVLAAEAVRTYGWVSNKTSWEDRAQVSTRSRATYFLMGDQKPNPTPEDVDMASKALEWAGSLRDKEELNDYEHNISVIAECEYMEMKSLGLAASIVGVYWMNCKRAAERAARAAIAGTSEFMGSKGDKLKDVTVTITSARVVESSYGFMNLYSMLTEDGNVLTWFASASQGDIEGKKMLLKTATVKEQKVYRDMKQTVVTRCKLEAI